MHDRSRRQITFSKRKSGLLKKAQDLNTLTGAPVFIIIVSEAQTVFTWASSAFERLEASPIIKAKLEQCLSSSDETLAPAPAPAAAAAPPLPLTMHVEEDDEEESEEIQRLNQAFINQQQQQFQLQQQIPPVQPQPQRYSFSRSKLPKKK